MTRSLRSLKTKASRNPTTLSVGWIPMTSYTRCDEVTCCTESKDLMSSFTQYTDPVQDNHGLAVHRYVAYHLVWVAPHPTRASLIDVLAHQLPSGVRSHFNKRCVAVGSSESGQARVRFADGSSHDVDLVIGADGIKSVVRAQSTSTSNYEEENVNICCGDSVRRSGRPTC